MRRAMVAVVAVVVLAVGMFLFGYPTRTYLEQRGALAQEQALSDRLTAQNQVLRSQAARLQTPAEIQRIARERYGLVEPGQEAYAILPRPVAAPRHPAQTQTRRRPAPAAPRPTRTAASPGVWSDIVHQLEFWN